MKFIPNQDWKEKIATLNQLIEHVRSGNCKPFEYSSMPHSARERVEDVTRFEQFKGRVYKQCGNRQRDFSAQ